MSSSEDEYKKFSKEINGGSVYSLYKPGVEKFYIGSSIQKLNKRLSCHKVDGKNESRNSPLYQTMRETGFEGWIIEPIAHYPDIKILADLLQKEQEFIDKVDKQFLLNKQKSTSGCKSKRELRQNEEYKQKEREYMRELRQNEEYKQKEREYNARRNQTEERKEYNRERMRELRQDEEYRQRERERQREYDARRREQKNAKRRERVPCPHCPPDAKDFSRGSLPNHIERIHPELE